MQAVPEIGKSIRVGGVLTNYHEAGKGIPVILIHGSGPGVSAWARLCCLVRCAVLSPLRPEITFAPHFLNWEKYRSALHSRDPHATSRVFQSISKVNSMQRARSSGIPERAKCVYQPVIELSGGRV